MPCWSGTWSGWLRPRSSSFFMVMLRSGAARETEMALELGIPVFYQLDPLATGAEDPGYRALLRYAMERDLVGVRR